MAKYKVGDMVKVRSDLKLECFYDDWAFVSGMDDFLGEIVKIIKIEEGSNSEDVYRIEGSMWGWTNPMFEEEKYNFPSKSDLMQLLEG